MSTTPGFRRHRFLGSALLALALLTVGQRRAAAHEDGVLKPATRDLTAGDSLAIAGEKFGARSRLALALVGMSGRIELGSFDTDSAGAFTSRVLIPRDAAPGSYRLVAMASDGDEVASVDMTVAAALAAADRGAAADHDATDMADAPSNEPLALDRARSPAVTWGVVGGILVALAVGGTLLRPTHDES